MARPSLTPQDEGGRPHRSHEFTQQAGNAGLSGQSERRSWSAILRLRPDGVGSAYFLDAMRLGNTHALRAYDAVQLAVAPEVNRSHQAGGSGPVTLISADRALNDAATTD